MNNEEIEKEINGLKSQINQTNILLAEIKELLEVQVMCKADKEYSKYTITGGPMRDFMVNLNKKLMDKFMPNNKNKK